jgi:hypothetical protein
MDACSAGRSRLHRFCCFIGTLLLIVISNAASAESADSGQPIDTPLADKLKARGAGLVIYRSDTISRCESDVLSGTHYDAGHGETIRVPDPFVTAALAHQAIYIDKDPYPRVPPLLDRILDGATFGWWMKHLGVFDLPNSHSREWTAAVKALRASGYETFVFKETILTGGCLIAIPQAYSGDSAQVDAQLDYALADVLYSYYQHEASDRSSLEDIQKANELLKTQMVAQHSVADALQTQINTEQAKHDELWTEVRDLHVKLGDYAFAPRTLLELLKKLQYEHDQDYLVTAIKENLQPIPLDINWDSSQVSDPYLQPELIAAIEKFQAAHGAELAALGLPKLSIVSAARTPINQLVQQSANPVATGIFTSGHVMGVAFDFNMAGTPVDVKPYVVNAATPDEFAQLQGTGLPGGASQARVNMYAQYKANPVTYRADYAGKLSRWQKVAALMAANDLPISDGLKDANHVFLGLYKGTSRAAKDFQNRVRMTLLRSYLNAMKTERQNSGQRLKDATSENQALLAAKLDLDHRIQQLQTNLDYLHAENARLAAEKSGLDDRVRDRVTASERGPGGRSGDGSYRPGRDYPSDAGGDGGGGGSGPSREESHETAAPSRDGGMTTSGKVLN